MATFWPWGFPRKNRASHNGPSPRRRFVDEDLIAEAARLVVTTRLASTALISRRLEVTAIAADAILGRLEHWGVIRATETAREWQVVTTSAELPGVLARVRRTN
jgi:ribosomal protein S25